MKYITLIRLLAEQIEECDSFVVGKEFRDSKIKMDFHYKEPIDRITWIIDSDFFDKYISNIIYPDSYRVRSKNI